MGASSVFKKPDTPGDGDGGSVLAGAAGATTQSQSLVDPAGYSSQNSISTRLRSERETEWRGREPPNSAQHKVGVFTASDGSQTVVRMSDLRNGAVFGNDSVTLSVASHGQKTVSVDHATYGRMKELYEVSKKSWESSYSKWRDEGEFNGFVAGYDGVGQKAARRTEF